MTTRTAARALARVSHVRLARIALPMSVAFLALTVLVAGESWPIFRGDRLRSGNPRQESIPARVRVRWSQGSCGDLCQVDASPAVIRGHVVVAETRISFTGGVGAIVALDSSTGEERWRVPTSAPIVSSPVIAEGLVLCGEGYHENRNCKLRCIDLETGAQVWQFKTSSHVEATPTVAGDRVYFGAGDDGLYCVGLRTGEKIWQLKGEHIDASALVTSGRVFVGIGYGDSGVVCLDARDGNVLWRTRTAYPVWGAALRVGARLFFGYGNGWLNASDPLRPAGGVLCLSAVDGRVIWRVPLEDSTHGAITYSRGRLLASSRDGWLRAFDPVDGRILWRASLGGPGVSSPLVDGERVLAVSQSGTLLIADLVTGEALSRTSLGELLGEFVDDVISSPALLDGRIYVGAGDGAVALEGW